MAVTEGGLGRGTSDEAIFLDNVGCIGTESRLFDCSANPIGSHNCLHDEDAGVRCQLRMFSSIARRNQYSKLNEIIVHPATKSFKPALL